MCGICGIVTDHAVGQIGAMTDALAHRGPDDQAEWTGPGVALGATRLAIVDLDGGRQPMVDGDLVLVANAEIYNHRELRQELEADGAVFRTRCDIEVLLHGYRRWGLSMLKRLRGFFAFALWDTGSRQLVLARDRFGIAPLVWTSLGGGVAFASETKALLTMPGFQAALRPAAVDALLAHRFQSEPATFWSGIEHLAAGHVMVWREKEGGTLERWYTPPESGSGPDVALQEAEDRFEQALAAAVSRRVEHGDVEAGLYLSGGVDSSLIGAFAAQSGRPIRAFSHGFDRRRDESTQAELAAEVAHASWQLVPLREEDVDDLPRIVRAVEQPVANPDILGLWALARSASKHVKAVICGEGADELFGSYPHQQLLDTLANRPPLVGRLAAAALAAVPARLASWLGPYPGAAADTLARQRLMTVLRASDFRTRHTAITSLLTTDERAGLYAPEFGATVREAAGQPQTCPEPASKAQTLDTLIDHDLVTWLPGYHLGRENRIAMAHGLEARYPFLDVDVVDAVLPLARSAKVGGPPPSEKRLLRRVARRRLPRVLYRRPKGPVRVPLDHFGARYRELVRDLLAPARVTSRGLFRPEAVTALVDRAERSPFLAGRQVFALVMLELWQDAFG